MCDGTAYITSCRRTIYDHAQCEFDSLQRNAGNVSSSCGQMFGGRSRQWDTQRRTALLAEVSANFPECQVAIYVAPDSIPDGCLLRHVTLCVMCVMR